MRIGAIMQLSLTSANVEGGVLLCILSLGSLATEKIVKTPWGPHQHYSQHYFGSYSLLILLSSLTTVVGALAIAFRQRTRSRTPLFDPIPRAEADMPPHLLLVAVCSFVSTLALYRALWYLSFTTICLAQVALSVGSAGIVVADTRKPQSADYVGVAVVLAGLWMYGLSPRSGLSPQTDDAGGLKGLLWLLVYFVSDSLTSLTSSYLSGRDSSSSIDPFALDSPILAQTVYIHSFRSAIALFGLLIEAINGTFSISLSLIFESPALQLAIFILIISQAVTTFLYKRVGFSTGKVYMAFINYVRPVLAMAVNAFALDNLPTITGTGWVGAVMAASGAWIFHRAVGVPAGDEKVGTRTEEEETMLESDSTTTKRESLDLKPTATPPLSHFAIPLSIPLLLLLFVAFSDPSSITTVPAITTRLNSTHASLHTSSNGTLIEGGPLDAQIHSAIAPLCTTQAKPVRWRGTIRTALASHPRSGNTLVRELVERTTGFQTSTVYCDRSLAKAFEGECDHSGRFLVKTHFPTRTWEAEKVKHYVAVNKFDQAIYVVRNPLDSIFSDYQLAHTPRTADGGLDHSAKVDIGKLGASAVQRADVLKRVEIYKLHEAFWHSVEIPVLALRYEDLMHSRFDSLVSMTNFLLPPSSRPSLTSLVCALEVDESKEAYHSRKSVEFSSWDRWHPSLRTHVIWMLRTAWCRNGYDRLLKDAMERKGGGKTGVEDVCKPGAKNPGEGLERWDYATGPPRARPARPGAGALKKGV